MKMYNYLKNLKIFVKNAWRKMSMSMSIESKPIENYKDGQINMAASTLRASVHMDLVRGDIF